MAYSNLSDLRTARDAALKDSDFWVLPDSPINPEFREVSDTAIKLYRQQLRDITVGVTDTKSESEGTSLTFVEDVELPSLVFPY
jgi:hypothetical protein|tara:strand:- start:332 stop:583 length:252 start_codon:yes stop_codon:yes gene_type:complete